MDSKYQIFWTDEAVKNLEDILDYLKNRWTSREVDNFKKKLSKQISLIQLNTRLFPISEYNIRLRKAVLSKQTTLFYELSENIVYLVYLFNTKQSETRLK